MGSAYHTHTPLALPSISVVSRVVLCWGMGKASQLSAMEREEPDVGPSARRSAAGGVALPDHSRRCCRRIRCRDREAAFGQPQHGDSVAQALHRRLDRLWDIAPGRGRRPKYEIDKIAVIVNATLRTKPAGMTHWSFGRLAQSQGGGKSTISNIWRAHRLQPHRTKTSSFRAIRNFWTR